MFEKLNTPEEIFSFKLGSALTMEKNVLDMLGDLQGETQRDELRQLFAHHAEETKGADRQVRRNRDRASRDRRLRGARD